MLKFNFKSEIKKVKSFDIKQNGIQLKELDDTIEIRVDVFRSIPLFLFESKENSLFLFDDMDFFNESNIFKKEIDVVGFWEILLFGTSLWSRTLFNNLYQLPSASSLIINKKDYSFEVKRYWDFNVSVDPKITSIDIAAELFNEHLDCIASRYDKTKNHLIGLSGGLDSRITLAYLSKHIKKDNLNTFTYAYSKDSLEYIKAKKTAVILGIKEPVFHKLSYKSYKDALLYLPAKSGGQIGINHCHIIDFLKNNLDNSTSYISTYFSDAIFGWDSIAGNSDNDKLHNPLMEIIKNSNFLEESIKKLIIKDIYKVSDGYSIDSNISCLKEYIYISERNQKFHNYLFNLQKDYVLNSGCFYHSYDFFKFSLSIPVEFKNKKRVEYFILNKYFPEISTESIGDISSNLLFRPMNKNVSLNSKLHFKFLNRANALFRLVFQGKFQLKNKYQTEELENILYSNFKEDLNNSFNFLFNEGIFNKKHRFLNTLPIKSKDTGYRYSIISISNYLKNLINYNSQY